MSKGVAYFLGILTGIALAAAAVFATDIISLSSGSLSMFNERGKMMKYDSFTIVRTYDNNHALAVATDELGYFAALNMAKDDLPQSVPWLVYTAVYIIGNEKTHFYDGMEIKSSKRTGFYQVGTYKYKTKEEGWKTVPAVMLMKKQ